MHPPALFPRTRAAVLACLLLDAERQWSLRELARHLGKTPSSLQAELASLTAQGILTRHTSGQRVLFQADQDCPYFEELRGLVAKTSGVPLVLREALAPLADRIELAFVYGSLAKGTANSDSDVDLFVVGDVSLRQLAAVLPGAGLTLGRPVNPTLFTPTEFRAKRRRDRFVRTVLDEDRLDVIGNSDALAVEGPPRAKARRATRTRRR